MKTYNVLLKQEVSKDHNMTRYLNWFWDLSLLVSWLAYTQHQHSLFPSQLGLLIFCSLSSTTFQEVQSILSKLLYSFSSDLSSSPLLPSMVLKLPFGAFL